MFKTFEEKADFSESARRTIFKSTARWSAAAVMAALWIQTLLFALLPAE